MTQLSPMREQENDRMSPLRIPEIDDKINNLGPISFSNYTRSPVRNSPMDYTPEKKRKI